MIVKKIKRRSRIAAIPIIMKRIGGMVKRSKKLAVVQGVIGGLPWVTPTVGVGYITLGPALGSVFSVIAVIIKWSPILIVLAKERQEINTTYRKYMRI